MAFRSFALAAVLLAAVSVSPAFAEDSGGAAAPGGSDAAPGAVGGASTPPRGGAPVAHLSVKSPLAGGGAPEISVRFSGPGIDRVIARVVVLRSPGNAVAARIVLGSVPTGRKIAVPWKGRALPAGQYVVRVHARDQWNRQLRRLAHASGKTTLVVKATPVPAAPAPVSQPPSADGVYPVVGAHSYGDLFGAPRKGYRHQGVDILAAEGTPIVSPLGGTVRSTGNQPSAAGFYVVVDAVDGHSYFYAHCQKGSIAVVAGAAVASGAAICRMGHTGDATGTHLHFEEWVGGWRVDGGSAPVDPLPQLKAWDS